MKPNGAHKICLNLFAFNLNNPTFTDLITLTKRSRGDRDVVARSTAIGQTPGHAADDELVGLGSPEGLQEPVPLHRLAGRHAGIGGGKVPWNAAVRICVSAEVR